MAEYSTGTGHLRVKSTGPWNDDGAKQLLDETKCEALKRDQNRIFFDFSCWTQPESEMTRFRAGEYLAKVLPKPFKIAAFTGRSSITKFGEDVAVNRGANFRVFTDEQTAIEWLME
ncbi:MAG TPA: hypothetical protein VHO84_04790 [Syntrophorhabdaceae bacterium]|nr:hypothetical protein [Syntrophorhabdaceae bacterium]